MHELDEDKDSIQDGVYDITPSPPDPKPKTKSKGKGKVVATGRSNAASLHRPATTMLAPGLSRPSARQNYALPLPSLNHRHRGTPIHLPPARTRRLLSEPKIFGHVETVMTRSVADPVIRERIAKATGYNFGHGPVWELIEDRSWFKECAIGDQTRPTAYKSLQIDQNCQFLSSADASLYMPESFFTPSSKSSTITCSFGPHENQTEMQLNPLQTHRMAKFFPESKSQIFYAGAPVWAIDWCPVSVEELPRRSYKQYLSVAPFPSYSHNPEIGRRAARPFFASIQIWSLSPILTDSLSTNSEALEDGAMKCELVLCIDAGPAHDLKWCPLPAHDEVSKASIDGSGSSHTQKLGLLAGTFEDGSLSFYVIPDPGSLASLVGETTYPSQYIFQVKLSPRLRVELEDTMCWTLDWANSDLVAVGCTNGSIAIFRVKEALENPADQILRPSHYFPVHQSAIRTLSWARAPPTSAAGILRLDRDPTVLISGGYDGAEMVSDIRDLRGNIMNRTRGMFVAFSQHVGGPLAPDHENTIKNFGMSPSTLGRGHAILEPSGPAWSIATSEFHSQIAVGSADGTCQTTNIMKSTRRGGAVPFFIHKIFQMDYNRASRGFRMLENFLPYEHQDRPAASRATKKKKDSAGEPLELPVSTGVWSPEVSVTRVTWQSGSGLARAPLLASATASGICRIDWLLGRFAHNRFPYRDIQTLRGEVEGAEDEEGEDELNDIQ
ncbi:hypothetical protein K439DRAFT_1346874 [Ramaria rubella]|nr:hypothetical protein K439DRAFT_1346874 [Ramaria rubella]